jgi:disulfide bond formation protein DsbB
MMLNLTIRSEHLRALISAWIAILACSLGLALYSQHSLGMMPCPWCVIQRLLMLLSLALSFLMLSSIRLPIAMLVPALAHLLLQLAGMAASMYQALVASHDSQCAMGLADRLLMASGLEQSWPWMFAASSSCAEAANASLFGLSFPWLGFGLFSIGVVQSLVCIRLSLRASFRPLLHEPNSR